MTQSQVRSIYDTILIVDFGSQYSHLITRRIRELGIYSEMMSCDTDLNQLDFQPKAIILSGGPHSVYNQQAPHLHPSFMEYIKSGQPVLGICYGLQEMMWQMGGKVEKCEKREFGVASVQIMDQSKLFTGLKEPLEVWMSHGDQVTQLAPGFKVIGQTETAPFAMVQHESLPVFGIQFHPEVTHTQQGKELLKNFTSLISIDKKWNMQSFIEMEVERIRKLVGPHGQVIGAVSGGVDSTVAACLMTKAIGSRFHAVLVDNGLMRLNECQEVKQQLKDKLGLNLTVLDCAQIFLSKLKGITDPEQKRKIIGNEFIHAFQKEAARLESLIEKKEEGKIEFLLQGTLYPDVIESMSFKGGPSVTIKTHHNVGGLLENMHLKLIEPLRELFKDEVREIGLLLDIEPYLVWRHPFPGPGLAIRVLGEVTETQLNICRKADAIYLDEIKKAGLYRSISQAYAALLPVRSVGVMGDQRTYQQVICLRAVTTTDFMTADWFEMPVAVLKRISSRIINEVDGVNRVVYDISSKPPATIEWE